VIPIDRAPRVLRILDAEGRARKERVMENVQDVKGTPGGGISEELRAELFRILDELVTARSDRTAALTSRFKMLWKQACGEGEPTLH
jgi:hypothetical protein